MSHTSHKVTVGCRYTTFSLCKNAHISAKTWSTGWSTYNCSCLNKCAKQSFFHCLKIDVLCCRNNDYTKTFLNLFAFQYLCCNSEIIHTSVCAGTNHNLIDGYITDFVNRFCIFRKQSRRQRPG